MHLTLHIWRQRGSGLPGGFVRYAMTDVSPDMSFLEMLDVLNQQLLARKDEPIAFDHDCREGICGMCGMVINGRPHGPQHATTTCQLHMRSFPDGAELWIEPWRAGAFPVVKDLVVDRGAFDRLIQAGVFVGLPRPAGSGVLECSRRLAAAIVAFSASADFLSAACSSGDSFTSRIFSNPLRPSLPGTPQYIADRPYSPCSQAAQESTRFLSCTMASTIWTTAAEGA